jgi:hypothetical protein
MKLNQQSLSVVETTIASALERYTKEDGQSAVTDIHIQPSSVSGEIAVFNDDDEELASAIVEQWVSYEGDDFYQEVEKQLRAVLHNMQDRNLLDNNILKPYSFVLVDDDKETIAELLLLDDDTLLVDNELLEGLDKELDDFLKELLEK